MPRKILVVDDEPDIIMALENVLDENGSQLTRTRSSHYPGEFQALLLRSNKQYKNNDIMQDTYLVIDRCRK